MFSPPCCIAGIFTPATGEKLSSPDAENAATLLFKGTSSDLSKSKRPKVFFEDSDCGWDWGNVRESLENFIGSTLL